MKIKLLLGASILLLVSVQVNADVINATNTNTEYSPGLFADLQGLEWLSIDETLGQSVDSILGGYGGFVDQGWRYATREETSLLLNSISGGISGVSNDPVPIAGASWFMANIANDDRYLTYSGFYSYFIYTDMGDVVPCRPYDPINYCAGSIGTQNETNVSGDITAAQFEDEWGLDSSISPVPTVALDFAIPFRGSLLVRPPPTEPVTIDIKPGSDPNSVNLRSKGVIPVAVLGSTDFDAMQVDYSTVKFGPDEALSVHDGHVEDVNDDDYMDMVFHFKTQETGIACGDTEATLTGATFGGIQFTGTDTVKTVGCK